MNILRVRHIQLCVNSDVGCPGRNGSLSRAHILTDKREVARCKDHGLGAFLIVVISYMGVKKVPKHFRMSRSKAETHVQNSFILGLG